MSDNNEYSPDEYDSSSSEDMEENQAMAFLAVLEEEDELQSAKQEEKVSSRKELKKKHTDLHLSSGSLGRNKPKKRKSISDTNSDAKQDDSTNMFANMYDVLGLDGEIGFNNNDEKGNVNFLIFFFLRGG